MFKTLANAWKIEDLRKKLIFTLIIVLLYRIGTSVPVPFVSGTILSSASSGTIFGFFNTLSGGAFEQGSLFALGVQPYITASIVIQLLTVAIPRLEKIAKMGEEGKKKITEYTRYLTIAISLITSFGYYLLLKNNGALSEFATDDYPVFSAFVIIACYCAGSSIVMWLAEKINEHGIGNGISIVLFANIVSRGAPLLLNFVTMFQVELYGSLYPYYGLIIGGNKYPIGSIIFTIFAIVGMLALMWFVIHISDSERRIPVQYAKRVSHNKMYGGQKTNLPLKLNMTGVMPIIFANAIVTIPQTLAMFISTTKYPGWGKFVEFCSSTSWFYALITFVLILAFAYFYVAISFNPTEVAENIKANGGAVPGIRPGRETAAYIQKILSKVTLIGALCLSVIAVVPLVINVIITAIAHNGGNIAFEAFSYVSELAYSGSSVIIVVGVILELVREIEAQMSMRHYKGILD